MRTRAEILRYLEDDPNQVRFLMALFEVVLDIRELLHHALTALDPASEQALDELADRMIAERKTGHEPRRS